MGPLVSGRFLRTIGWLSTACSRAALADPAGVRAGRERRLTGSSSAGRQFRLAVLVSGRVAGHYASSTWRPWRRPDGRPSFRLATLGQILVPARTWSVPRVLPRRSWVAPVRIPGARSSTPTASACISPPEQPDFAGRHALLPVEDIARPSPSSRRAASTSGTGRTSSTGTRRWPSGWPSRGTRTATISGSWPGPRCHGRLTSCPGRRSRRTSSRSAGTRTWRGRSTPTTPSSSTSRAASGSWGGRPSSRPRRRIPGARRRSRSSGSRARATPGRAELVLALRGRGPALRGGGPHAA